MYDYCYGSVISAFNLAVSRHSSKTAEGNNGSVYLKYKVIKFITQS